MADPTPLVQTLWTRDTWAPAGVALAIGALGGLAHYAGASSTQDGQAPTKTSAWREMLIGAVAAAAFLFVTNPKDGLTLVSASLIAGYGGRAVMAALEDKAKAVATQQQLVQARSEAIEASAKEEVAADYAKQLLGEVEKVQTQVQALPAPAGGGGQEIRFNTALLDAVKERFGSRVQHADSDGAAAPSTRP